MNVLFTLLKISENLGGAIGLQYQYCSHEENAEGFRLKQSDAELKELLQQTGYPI